MNKSINIFLSQPAVYCCAGTDASSFYKSLVQGSQKGIVKTKYGENFYNTGLISEDDLNKIPLMDNQRINGTRLVKVLSGAVLQLKDKIDFLKNTYGAHRIAVCTGVCDNNSELSLWGHNQFVKEGTFPDDYNLSMQSADSPALYISKLFGLTGLTLTFATACSSSASALIKARQLIKSGLCDAAIAGGVDLVSDTAMLGFNSLGAVSQGITNPFSKNRDGITLGEGAAFFILSREDIDNNRIILAGTGESADANHLTAPLETGEGAVMAMQAALNDAGLTPQNIQYINLHGTGTRLNDSMESKAVSTVFGSTVPVSSTKPVTGHTLGAAGALEAAACYLSIKGEKLPVHVFDGEKDPDIPPLNFVTPDNQALKINCCMSNSFAFGGCNASLIIQRITDF